LPNRIRAERAQLRMSQEQLGSVLGVTRDTVAAWENEKYDIPSSAVKTLSEFFQCSSDWLLGISDKQRPA